MSLQSTMNYVVPIIKESKQRMHLKKGGYYAIKDAKAVQALSSSAALDLLRCLDIHVGHTDSMELMGSKNGHKMYLHGKTQWIYVPLHTFDFLIDIQQGRRLDVLL